jgi:hypothetical protein
VFLEKGLYLEGVIKRVPVVLAMLSVFADLGIHYLGVLILQKYFPFLLHVY